jgi:DivIVA domain-containing protein
MELDLPVLTSAEQIRRRQFVSVRRGFDPHQVREYLEQVAEHVEQMEAMLRDARLEAEAATRSATAPKTDPYEQLADRVAGVIRSADEEGDRLRQEAREEAERILGEARAEADRVALDAQSKAEAAKAESERALRDAREQADVAIAGLSSRRETLVDQLAAMQERLLSVARDLEAAIEPGPEMSTGPSVVLGEAGEEPASAHAEGPEPDEIVRPEPEAAVHADVDPRYEELWAGTETIDLSIPDIPPLDLDWGSADAEGDADANPDADADR